MRKRILSLLLVLCIAAALLPLQAHAATEGTYGPFKYFIEKNNTVILTECDSSVSGVLTVPASINGLPVAGTYNDGIFAELQNVTKIVLPASFGVFSLGDHCNPFSNLKNLQEVEIASDNPYIRMEDGFLIGIAREGVDGDSLIGAIPSRMRKSMTLPRVRYIAMAALAGCDQITSLVFPNTLDDTGYASLYCSGLRSVYIPKAVGVINMLSFDGCKQLKDVYYGGTQQDWDKIEVRPGNEPLLNATLHCNADAMTFYNPDFYPDYQTAVRKWFVSREMRDVCFYLTHSSNFPNTLFVREREGTTSQLVVEFVTDFLYRGWEGWDELINSSLSVGQAEQILAGLLLKYQSKSLKQAEKNVGAQFAECFVDGLDLYLIDATTKFSLKNADIQKLKRIITKDKVDELLQEKKFASLIGYLQLKGGYTENSNVVQAVESFMKSKKLADAMNKEINILSGCLKVAELSQETFEKVYQLECLSEADEMYIEMLQYLRDQCVFAPVQQAAGHLYDVIHGSYWEQMDYVAKNLGKELVATGADKVLDVALEGCMPALIIKKAFNFGIDSANLLFGTADSLEAYSQMRSLAYIGQTLTIWITSICYPQCAGVIDKPADDDAIREAAKKYYYSLDLLWAVRVAGEEAMQNFLRINRATGSSLYSMSVNEAGILNGYREVYFESEWMQNFVQTMIACPVDVSVLDAGGRVLLTVRDGTETSGQAGDIHYEAARYPGEDAYYKLIRFPKDSDYSIVCTGNDIGAVQCAVSEIRSDGFVSERAFVNVPTAKNAKITIQAPDVQRATYSTTDTSGKTEQHQFETVKLDTYTAPSSIRLSSSSCVLGVGERRLLGATLTPGNVSLPIIRWSSSDPSVVKVNGDGVLTGAAVGKAVVTATSEDGTVSAKCVVTVQKNPNPFTDVRAGEYYYDPVLWAVNHDPQITNGTSATTFSPDATCTRGQVVTFLWRAKGCPEPKNTKNPFSDVTGNAYYCKAVLWANENGVTNGTTPTTFSPDAPCTRAHVVTFLWRAEGQPKGGGQNPFRDVPGGEYYTNAVLWAVAKGITNGTSATTFSPDAPCTRAQVVTFLYRDMKDQTAAQDPTPTPKQCTVTFNANGGTLSGNKTKQIPAGGIYGTLPTATRTGYRFLGWFTQASGGTQVSESTKVTSSHTLYAHWEANRYTVTFNANGGSASQSSRQVAYNDPYGTLPTATRTGHRFLGWFTAASGGTQVSESTKVTASHTLYAHWEADKYTVTFNANGGSASESSRQVAYNAAYGTLPTATRTGHRFLGWFTAASGGTQVSESTKVTASHTLYAHWEANRYTVTFNANGGSASESSRQVAYNAAYGTLPTATRTGHRFLGWFTAASGGTQVSESTKVTASHTLYAHWEANRYTVTFNANGGSASESSRQVAYNAAYGTLPTATRTGYRFLGWYTTPYGGTRITDSTVMRIAAAHTLYAVWGAGSTMFWGDYDMDGDIDFDDITGFNKVRLDPDSYTAGDRIRGDVNADGTVDFKDIMELNKVRNGQPESSMTVWSYQPKLVVKSAPSKTIYQAGQWLNPAGLVLELQYLNDNGTGTNGGSHVITDGFVISGYDPNRSGTQTVTVSYFKLSTTFQVVVRSP